MFDNQAHSGRRAGLVFSDVCKRFGNHSGDAEVLSNVGFSVMEGEFVSLVGRSGSGKSTLLRIAAGLLAASKGTVHYSDEAQASVLRNVRYVFQDYRESLFPWKSVHANVVWGAHRRGQIASGEARAVADTMLEAVGLAAHGDAYPWQLSGGMQQRVAIARALASQPRILLMDEPFGAVDALSRANLQSLILRLWEEYRLTILLVTHDIDEAVYLSDRVVVLRPHGDGVLRIVETNMPRPRSHIGTFDHSRFHEARRELLELVLDEGLERAP